MTNSFPIEIIIYSKSIGQYEYQLIYYKLTNQKYLVRTFEDDVLISTETFDSKSSARKYYWNLTRGE